MDEYYKAHRLAVHLSNGIVKMIDRNPIVLYEKLVDYHDRIVLSKIERKLQFRLEQELTEVLHECATNDIYIAGTSNSFSINKQNNWFLLKNPSFPTSGNTVYNYIYNFLEYEDDDDEEIPGYNLLIVLYVIFGVISRVIITKRFKH